MFDSSSPILTEVNNAEGGDSDTCRGSRETRPLEVGPEQVPFAIRQLWFMIYNESRRSTCIANLPLDSFLSDFTEMAIKHI